MFRLELFKIRMFSAGNIAGFLASLARGGLNLMIIIWLQGIWLPLHGYSFEDTPLWAGIYMLPLTIGFMIMGPLSGYLSDRYGARTFSTAGMLVTAAGFGGLLLVPTNFVYPTFALAILIIGMGMGMFVSPNTTAIMNSVPAEHRGASSGMRATFQNTANTISITWIFTMVTIGLAAHLPNRLVPGADPGRHSERRCHPGGQPAAHRRALCGFPRLQPDGDLATGQCAAPAAGGFAGRPAWQVFLPQPDRRAFRRRPAHRLLDLGGLATARGGRFVDAWAARDRRAARLARRPAPRKPGP